MKCGCGPLSIYESYYSKKYRKVFHSDSFLRYSGYYVLQSRSLVMIFFFGHVRRLSNSRLNNWIVFASSLFSQSGKIVAISMFFTIIW